MLPRVLVRITLPYTRQPTPAAAFTLVRRTQVTTEHRLHCKTVGWSPVRNHPVYVRGGQVSDWEESQVLAALAVSELQRLCSDGALQTAHDIWENWTTGASHAGDSFSLGL